MVEKRQFNETKKVNEKGTIINSVESGQNEQDCDLETNRTASKNMNNCKSSECNKSVFQEKKPTV